MTSTLLGIAGMDQQSAELIQSIILTAGRCPEPVLDAGLRPLLTRPGKRLRPALVFGAAACGPELDRTATAKCAAALELMHLSSLIHDDLMDNADSRSGLPTLHTSGGTDAAILGGDYLLAVGGRLVTEVSAKAAMVWHNAYLELCIGQARETANCFRRDVTMTEYLAAIQGKTSALLAASCRLGAMCGGLGPAETEAFTCFGQAFGMVFQLVDDLMDVVATAERWAKPVRQDVPNGVYTACVIAAFEDDRVSRDLGRTMTTAQVDRVYAHARRVGVARAVDLIGVHIGLAEQALATLPDSPQLAVLAGLPRGYAERALCQADLL